MRRFRAHFRVTRSAPCPFRGGPIPRASHPGSASDVHADHGGAANHSAGTGGVECGGGGGGGRRLNLLLSWGGWRPDSWADNIECLLRPMGVESIRARTARQAEQVIRSSPIHIAVVDLGLPLETGCTGHAPDEAGCRVLDLLRRLDAPPPTVVVRSTRAARDASRDLNAALRFNAFAVVDRTSADVELMLKVLQRCMERFYHGRWPISG